MMPGSACVVGLGAVTPAGVGVRALCEALANPDWSPTLGLARPDAPALPVALCHEFRPQDHLPPLVARRLDRPARLLAVAAREALATAGDLVPADRTRVGVTAGTWNAGTEALLEVLRAIFLASPDEAPPMQFPSTVANAPASQLGILEKLGGPNLTFSEKQIGGLRALTEGVRLLARRRADLVLSAGVDEAQWLNAEGYARLRALRTAGRPGMVLAEGAAIVAIGASPTASALATVAGWGSAAALAPPHRYPDDHGALLRACELALARAGLRREDVDAVFSAVNGIGHLAELERRALTALFGARRPAAAAISDRLGEGAFGGMTRVLAAILAVSGQVLPAWPAPPSLAAEGFRSLGARPATILIPGQAAGGSAIALLIATP